MKRGARVISAPTFLRSYQPNSECEKIGIRRVRSSTAKRELLTGGPPFHIMPEIIHLYLVLCERGIVLFNQNFPEVERPPAHFGMCGGSERLDSHHRQIRVNAAVEEIKIKSTRHASLHTIRGLNKDIQHGTRAAQATGPSRCPLWVKSGHRIRPASCPFYPQKRTWVSTIVMSALCHKRTLAPNHRP